MRMSFSGDSSGGGGSRSSADRSLAPQRIPPSRKRGGVLGNRTSSESPLTRLRRRGHSSHYTRTLPYSSSLSDPDQSKSLLHTRLPSLIILSSFFAGWLLGRHEGARGIGVNLAVHSAETLRSTGRGTLVFLGLIVHNQCESVDGRQNVAFCSIPELVGKLMRERVALERRMQSSKEYGAYYNHIFNDESTRPSSIFPSSSTDERIRRRSSGNRKQTPLFHASLESAKRLTRRILIKHLQAVIREKTVSQSGSPPPTFTWVTAGDATAAAHGNLYSQSYTAVLQDTVESAFRSLGINFQAMNYGMGQYSSGPELGLCMNEVFGDDIDVLMWDFASLQPSWEPVRRSVLWSHRAGMHPTRPILFSIDSFGDRFVNLGIESMGTILMDSDAMQSLREKMPDTNILINLPDALRNYRCGSSLEGGVRCNDNMRNFVCYLDDEMMSVGADESAAANTKVCRDNKFRTKPECIDARYQASWHPGWKDHMLRGRLIGHFLLNSMEDALFELDQLKHDNGDDATTLLDMLERFERRDKRTFRQSTPDTKFWDEEGVVFGGMETNLVLRGESICHTALLPSRSRLEGVTTEVDGDMFDKGVNQFLMSTPEDGVLPLAYDMNDRQQCELLEVDHKDFFLVREQDGWISTVVPNSRELLVYKRSTPVKGIIVVCLKICPLNKCPDAYININEVSQRTKLFITVDGQPVKNVQKLDSCHILEGENGISWGRKDQFELRFRINAPGTLRVLKISSIIVF